jgi:hypothetical protein
MILDGMAEFILQKMWNNEVKICSYMFTGLASVKKENELYWYPEL